MLGSSLINEQANERPIFSWELSLTPRLATTCVSITFGEPSTRTEGLRLTDPGSNSLFFFCNTGLTPSGGHLSIWLACWMGQLSFWDFSRLSLSGRLVLPKPCLRVNATWYLSLSNEEQLYHICGYNPFAPV